MNGGMRGMRRGSFTPPVLIILTIIIFAVAILIAINTDLVKRVKNEPPPTQTLSSTTTSDAGREPTGSAETAQRKIYTNEKAGFSFNYPNDLYSFKEICGELEHPNYEVTLYAQKLSCQEFEKYPFSSGSTQSIFAIYVSDSRFNLQEEFEKGAAKDINVKTEYIDFNSIPAVRASTTLVGANSIVVTFNHADYGFQLIYTESDEQKYQLNQILSTFRFN